MYQCSYCTGASVYCSGDAKIKCIISNVETPHVCDGCSRIYSVPKKCYLCTDRPHVCFTECYNGCVKKKPSCRCENSPVRLQVKKLSKNHGRYFWSCRSCNLFNGINVFLLRLLSFRYNEQVRRQYYPLSFFLIYPSSSNISIHLFFFWF